jgi:hypothetical protein
MMIQHNENMEEEDTGSNPFTRILSSTQNQTREINDEQEEVLGEEVREDEADSFLRLHDCLLQEELYDTVIITSEKQQQQPQEEKQHKDSSLSLQQLKARKELYLKIHEQLKTKQNIEHALSVFEVLLEECCLDICLNVMKQEQRRRFTKGKHNNNIGGELTNHNKNNKDMKNENNIEYGTEIYDRALSDVQHDSSQVKCDHCSQTIASSRFAPHLERCMMRAQRKTRSSATSQSSRQNGIMKRQFYGDGLLDDDDDGQDADYIDQEDDDYQAEEHEDSEEEFIPPPSVSPSVTKSKTSTTSNSSSNSSQKNKKKSPPVVEPQITEVSKKSSNSKTKKEKSKTSTSTTTSSTTSKKSSTKKTATPDKIPSKSTKSTASSSSKSTSKSKTASPAASSKKRKRESTKSSGSTTIKQSKKKVKEELIPTIAPAVVTTVASEKIQTTEPQNERTTMLNLNPPAVQQQQPSSPPHEQVLLDTLEVDNNNCLLLDDLFSTDTTDQVDDMDIFPPFFSGIDSGKESNNIAPFSDW